MSPAHRLVPALMLCLSLAGSALAHNGEPRPQPLISVPPLMPGQAVLSAKAPRWSWVHWWEANRDRFLQPPVAQQAQGPTTEPLATTQQAPATQESDPLRLEAIHMLLNIIDKSNNEDLVEAATLAIGKMQYHTAIPLLGAAAQKRKSQRVRRAALVALGLIGGPEAEIQILAFKPTTLDDRIAAIAALGLLPEIQDTTLQLLRNALMQVQPQQQKQELMNRAQTHAAVNNADARTGAMICWALRQHHARENLHFFHDVLWNNDNPWVASEAITALGAAPESTDELSKMLLADPNSVLQIASWAKLDELNREKAFAGGQRGAMRQQQPQRAAAAGPALMVGEEMILMSELRSSAAIALGHVKQDAARDALLQFLEPSQNDYLFAPRSFAIMALTQYPSDATRDRLILLLGKKDQQGRMQLSGAPGDPTRGFAALALGLYAQPQDSPNGPADRPGFDQAMITLAERLDDQQDNLETRCACAVALGLTRRTDVLPVLVKEMQKLNLRQRATDELLYGYILLGRALAGDRNLIEPASGLLLRQGDETSAQGILARRASVLALGVMRSGAVVPILTQAWHLNYWVNREVIVALKLVGAMGAARPIMDRLRTSKDPREQAYMAQALGELLAKEQPTRLTRLMAETNFTVRDDPATPIKEYANEFLFGYLIPSFGDSWR